jgi:hypothetical protein
LIYALTEVVEIIEPDVMDAIRRHLEKEEVRRVMDEIMGSGAAGTALRATVNNVRYMGE